MNGLKNRGKSPSIPSRARHIYRGNLSLPASLFCFEFFWRSLFPVIPCRTDKSIYYTLDFNVTPHLLRHTYITNLIHEGVDPKTVQYLAGHENSKVTMDIYAKVKYNKPWELAAVVNDAFQPSTEYRENPAS